MKKYLFLIGLLNLFFIEKSFSFDGVSGIENKYYKDYLYDIKNVVINETQEIELLKIFQQKFGTYLPISNDMFQYGDKNKICKKLFIIKKLDPFSNNKIVTLYLECQENKNIYYVQLFAEIKKNKIVLSTTKSKYLCCLLFSYETDKTCDDYGFEEPICESETMFYGKNSTNINKEKRY